MGAKVLRISIALLCAFFLLNFLSGPATAAPSETCLGVAQQAESGGRVYNCISVAGKLKWDSGKPLVAQLSRTPTPQIKGTPQVDKSLEVLTGSWDAGTVLQFQWFRNGKTIPSAIDQTYVPNVSDVGAKISVRVIGLKPKFKSVTKSSNATAPVKAPAKQNSTIIEVKDFASPKAPTIAESPIVGNVLFAKRSNWAPNGVRYSYQWLSDGVEISGATTPLLKLTQKDVGKQVVVAVTGTGTGYKPTTMLSKAIAVRSNLKVLPAAKTVQIQGMSVLNSVVSVKSPWASAVDVQIQWYRNSSPISAANKPSYKLVKADEGALITARVATVEPGYVQVIADTLPLGPITATQLLKFTKIGDVTVSGQLIPGSTLTVTNVGWDTGVTFNIRWLADGQVIDGQTSSSYTISELDTNKTISVAVTAMKDLHESLDKVEVAGKVLVKNFASTPVPVITGPARTGASLAIAPSSLGWSSPASISYQWLKNGQPISGATSATFTISEFDLGGVISVVVTGKAVGYHTSSRISVSTEPIISSTLQGSQPIISGAVELDQVLTLSEGAWDSGTSLAFQWFADGVAIAGATSKTFKITSTQVGKAITAQVIGSKAGFENLAKTSNPTSLVTMNEFSSAPVPTITGGSTVGSILTATTGTWSPTATLTFQWLKDGVAISGATTNTYTIRLADIDSQISIEVRGSKSGYGVVTKESLRIVVPAPPKLPTITSTVSKVSSFEISWSKESVANYTFTVLNGSGQSVGSYTCASSSCQSPFTISGLPTNAAATQYTVNFQAVNEGGTVTGSTMVSTYPKQTLAVTVNSIVRTGDQFVFNFQSQANWTYQFNNYGTYDNSNCGVMSSVYTTSPLTVYLPKGTCTMEFLLTDGRGNSNSAIIPANITKVTAPAAALTGTLSSNSVTPAESVDYSLTYFSYFPYYTFNLVIVNSAGTAVSPNTPITATRSGDSWSGTKSGKIFWTGFQPGAYTVRADWKSTSDVRYGYDQESSITLGVVTVT